MSPVRRLLLISLLSIPLVMARPANADFPPITDAERGYGTSTNQQQDTPAVVLFRNADLRFLDRVKSTPSRLEVYRRVKILTEEGKEFGEFRLQHSKHIRLSKLDGRTVLPDGRIIELDDDGIFREEVSKSSRLRQTKVAMPAVEVGAILDLHYVFTWESYFYLEPWHFDQHLPVLHSEITYTYPDTLGVKFWGKKTTDRPMEQEAGKSPRGTTFRVWMDNIPPLPDENFSPPDVDMSSSVMVIPISYLAFGDLYDLLRDWKVVGELIGDTYKEFVGGAGSVKKKAKTLVASAGTDRRAQAKAVYQFVRDDIRLSHNAGIFVYGKGELDQVLANGAGTTAEKALLLHTMLDAIKAKPTLVWAASRRDGQIDTSVANPEWFDRMLVAVDLDGQRVLLDASDSGLGFGQLSPNFEGMPAVILSRKPEVIQVGSTPTAANLGHVVNRLTLDAEGRLTGTGEAMVTGHQAWQLRADSDDDTLELWREDLEEQYAGFAISELAIEDLEPVAGSGDDKGVVEDRPLRVTWKLSQREEEVLGDEASFSPGLPWLRQQLFVLPPEKRLTPVQMMYPFRDVIETTISWPAGWAVEEMPPPADVMTAAGIFRMACQVDEAARTATCANHFELTSRDFVGKAQYTMLRDLYDSAASNHAIPLLLVQR